MGAGGPFFAIRRILIIQAAVLAVLPAVLLVFLGWQVAGSALAGGLVGFIPNIYFAWRIAASRGRPAREVVRSFYSGELVKIAVTAGLFVVVFQIPKILILPLFAGFIGVLSVLWFALLLGEPDNE